MFIKKPRKYKKTLSLSKHVIPPTQAEKSGTKVYAGANDFSIFEVSEFFNSLNL